MHPLAWPISIDKCQNQKLKLHLQSDHKFYYLCLHSQPKHRMTTQIITPILLLCLLATLLRAATPSASLPVIVIGAGMAGAGAARRLAENNIPVIVLEARSRLGGRVFTDKSMGVPGM